VGSDAERSSGIRVITRAATILRLLGRETDGLSLGQIAGQVDLPRSTVQRIVAALADEGFVVMGRGDSGIRLGPELRSLAQSGGPGMTERLRPSMKHISEQTGETVDLAVLDGNSMRFVDQIIGRHRLRTASSVDERFPLTCTANGKAALACLAPEKALALMQSELAQRGTRTRPLDELLVEIAAIRNGAVARDIDEHTDGISALGYAVRDSHGDIYAVSVPVPSSRFQVIETSLEGVINASRSEYGPL
jgi:DNA-binding IclR family transcriptional regulator